MKNMNYIILISLAVMFIISCNEQDNNCLPFEGEIFGGACNGFIIKVTNKEINSFMESGNGIVDNVIVARFPNNIVIDSTFLESKFYFDFRELRTDEQNICTHSTAEPNLKVLITSFSLTKCNEVDN